MLVFTLVFGAVDAGVADSFGDGKACEDAGDADLHELHRGAEHGAHLHAEGPATGSEPNEGVKRYNGEVPCLDPKKDLKVGLAS